MFFETVNTGEVEYFPFSTFVYIVMHSKIKSIIEAKEGHFVKGLKYIMNGNQNAQGAGPLKLCHIV
jgi:hypothetical protein